MVLHRKSDMEIAALRDRIRAGAYQVDPWDVADAMLDEMRDLRHIRQARTVESTGPSPTDLGQLHAALSGPQPRRP